MRLRGLELPALEGAVRLGAALAFHHRLQVGRIEEGGRDGDATPSTQKGSVVEPNPTGRVTEVY